VAPITIPRRGREELTDLPQHYERVPLVSALRVIGWPAGVAGVVLGVWWMATRDGSPLEVVGAVLATLSGGVLLGLVRCRAFETTVGVRWVEGRTGPLRHRVPFELVEGVASRPAGAWRRLFGVTEVVLRLGSEGREVVLPSREPGDLVEAIERAGRRWARSRPSDAGDPTDPSPT